MNSKNNKKFYSRSRTEDIEALKQRECFKILDVNKAIGHRVYRPRFVDLVKADSTGRSRLCLASCNDQEHGMFTAASIIKHISIQVSLASRVTERLKLRIRDVIKPFVMIKTVLRRPVNTQARKIWEGKKKAVRVIRPVHGMPESLIHLFKTYTDYHEHILIMTSATMAI